jgi:2-polyprenyl-3-methyl-5-hydroxy-6-metoxy-1,4-benzoquinol methylase
MAEGRADGSPSSYFSELGARLHQQHADEVKYVVTLLEEAQFGYYVAGARLPKAGGASARPRVLEIGAGAYILSSWLAAEGYDVTAMEPLGTGFGALARIQNSVLEFAREKDIEFAVSADFMEQHVPVEPYDFAFAINVFEHIDKIDDAFGSVTHLVKPGSVVRVACPNYHVPYESHYGVPIIGSGALTRKLFHRHITAFDRENDCTGLWESLNFITSSEVARRARRARLGVRFDKSVVEHMFARFEQPSAFTRRHGAIGGMARVANVLKLPRVLRMLPMPMQPYMVFDLTAPARDAVRTAA